MPTSFPTISSGEAWDTGAGQASALMNQITGAINALETAPAAFSQYPYIGLGGNSYESIPRHLATLTSASITGQLRMFAIVLPAGLAVGHISLFSGSANSNALHWWFGLYDSSRVQLAVTADQTSAAWPANTMKTLAIATTAAGAASSFTTTYAGLYYVGVLQAASTSIATLRGSPVTYFDLSGASPILDGFSGTGLTTPPGFPTTAAAITNSQASCPWCAVGP